jgi:hypothetical protein
VALGVVALKTPACARACRAGAAGEPGASSSCPLCAYPSFFAATVARVPSCRRTVSRLHCPVTGSDEGDAYHVLPSGQVVSAAALAVLTSGAFVLDATTGEVFDASATRKAYFA